MERIKGSGALLPQPLTITDEKSLWGADVFIGISKEIPDANMEKSSTEFIFITPLAQNAQNSMERIIRCYWQRYHDFCVEFESAERTLYFHNKW